MKGEEYLQRIRAEQLAALEQSIRCQSDLAKRYSSVGDADIALLLVRLAAEYLADGIEYWQKLLKAYEAGPRLEQLDKEFRQLLEEMEARASRRRPGLPDSLMGNA